MKRFEKIFFTGIFTLLPVGVTLWVLSLLFKFTDALGKKVCDLFLPFQIPGLGFVLAVIGILIIGIFAQWVFGKKIIQWFEKFILKIPFVNTIYNAAKGVTHSFSKNKGNGFNGVVIVNFPTEEFKSIGFITKENLLIEDTKYCSVFIPTTPNPTNGFLVLLEVSKIELLDISVDSAIRAIISMGSVMPDVLFYSNKQQ